MVVWNINADWNLRRFPLSLVYHRVQGECKRSTSACVCVFSVQEKTPKNVFFLGQPLIVLVAVLWSVFLFLSMILVCFILLPCDFTVHVSWVWGFGCWQLIFSCVLFWRFRLISVWLPSPVSCYPTHFSSILRVRPSPSLFSVCIHTRIFPRPCQSIRWKYNSNREEMSIKSPQTKTQWAVWHHKRR